MNTGGEAAEQIVRMSLRDLRSRQNHRAGAKNIAILLYSILKEEKKTKGQGEIDEYVFAFWKGAESLYRSSVAICRNSRRKQRNTAYFTASLQTARTKTLMQRSM